MKKLLIACGILLGSLASAGGIGNLPETVRHFSDGMRNILPDAADVIPNGRGRYTVRNAKQQTIGTLFLEQITDDERQMGYAGTIEIALLFDRDGKVAGVLIGKNQETVSFLNRVRAARFLERWNGLRMEEIPGRDYPTAYGPEGEVRRFDTRPLVAAVCADIAAGVSPAAIARGFMDALARMAREQCRALNPDRLPVVLSGGVFLNQYLLRAATRLLEGDGYAVFSHHRVSASDEGLALGQLALAARARQTE